MPDVRPILSFTVTLTPKEFKLITRALAGLIREGTLEAKEANTLNIEMLRVRSAYIEDLKKVCDGALEKALELPVKEERKDA